jgi:preprotein translocase subunit SecE
MESIKTYIEGAYQELMHKVTWPTWSELQSSGVIVLVASGVIGIVFSYGFASNTTTNVIYKFLENLG